MNFHSVSEQFCYYRGQKDQRCLGFTGFLSTVVFNLHVHLDNSNEKNLYWLLSCIPVVLVLPENSVAPFIGLFG